MVIKFRNVSYKNNIKTINLNLGLNKVISIIGDDEEKINSIFDLIYGFKLPTDGEITINKEVINGNTDDKKLIQIRKSISYVTDNCDEVLFNINILEDIKYGLDKFDEKKLYELLQLFNLDINILKKNYMEISDSEKKKICIISALLKEVSVIMIANITDYLDIKSKQNLIKLLKKEKRNNKFFIITSQDANFLLQVSDEVLVINNNEIKKEEDKYNIFSNKKIINKIQMDMPWILMFKNKVLEMKNIKLTNRDNVNDLLKDIYRNATEINK